MLEGHGHGWSLRIWCGDVEAETLIDDGFSRRRTKGTYPDVSLNEIREIFPERLNACGTEKNEKIIIEILNFGEIGANGFEHISNGEPDLVFIEEHGYFGIVRLGKRDKEIFIPVPENNVNQILEQGFAMEDLSFTIADIFLKVEGHILSDAEVLHGVGDHHAKLVAYPEIVVNCRFTGEDNGCEFIKVDLLQSEVLTANAFNLNKGFEVYSQVVFPGQFKVGGLRVCGLRL